MAKEQPLVTTLDGAKRWLRRHLVRVRQGIGDAERRRLSAQIARALTASTLYRRSRTVALFIGFGSEVHTEVLIRHAWKAGKNVLIPITSLGFEKPFFALFRKGDKLVRTPYGPLELRESRKPFKFRSIDLVVVPGLGFDTEGFRVGYGGGVYDRLLSLTHRSRHVGVFFSAQRLHAVPRGRHDHPLQAVVTEHGLMSVARSAPSARPLR